MALCNALVASEEELNELDRGSGDGDCGSTLKGGAEGEERAELRVETYQPYLFPSLLVGLRVAGF